jgi:hypothetical protein
MRTARSVSLTALQADLDDIFTTKRLASLMLNIILGTPVADSSPDELTLLQSQKEIGWDNYITGCISIHWKHLYESLYTPHKHPTPNSWAAKFVNRIWKYTLSLWNHRNEVVHGRDSAEQEVIP